jgi:uncharacterized protein (DUF4213/DUF364 family)
MNDPKYVYQLLLDHCASNAVVEHLMIGVVWTLCQNNHNHGIGLAMSPASYPRNLAWSGDLNGKAITDLANWIYSWDPHQASVALAAINSCINIQAMPETVGITAISASSNLAVFEHFLPLIQHQKVVVIGHYPGIEQYQTQMELTVLERQLQPGDLPDSASEFLLPNADWVFLTASSLANKTFPRLATLASSAKTVLMGPSLPWIPHWHEFGIDYLAGIEILDANCLQNTVAQGGGMKIFDHAIRYRIAELNPLSNISWLKQQISDCYAKKAQLTAEMDAWYTAGKLQRFPNYEQLETLNSRLSKLDSSYKLLWDQHHQGQN